MGVLLFNGNDSFHSIREEMTIWQPVDPTFVRAFLDSDDVGPITEFRGPLERSTVARIWLESSARDVHEANMQYSEFDRIMSFEKDMRLFMD